MPELPEVHTTARVLDDLITGSSITAVWTSYQSPFHSGKDNVKDPKYFSLFRRHVVGATITGVARRAKNVLIHLSNGYTILVHMKMTGHLLYGTYTYSKKDDVWRAAQEGPLKDPFNQWLRLVFTLSDGNHLALSDLRKFAKVTLLSGKDLSELEAGAVSDKKHHLYGIGPEPLEKSFTRQKMAERLMRFPKGRIKQVLMNQEVIAGIGNIYSDEILWRIGVHPESRIAAIPPDLMLSMHKAMKEILSKGIDFGGDSTSDYRNPFGTPGEFQYHHKAYRRTGSPCPKKGCYGVIKRKVVGGRSAHFCDTHQILYK
jgi:formamidopyrimidine-DNA glycosylase